MLDRRRCERRAQVVCVILDARLKYKYSLDSEYGRRYDGQTQKIQIPPVSIILRLVTKVAQAGRSTRPSSFKFCRKNRLRMLCLTYNKLPNI